MCLVGVLCGCLWFGGGGFRGIFPCVREFDVVVCGCRFNGVDVYVCMCSVLEYSL